MVKLNTEMEQINSIKTESYNFYTTESYSLRL